MTFETTATLTLDGTLSQDGFRVTLVVQGQEGARETRGHLPANAPLCQALEHWRQSYQSIQGTTRITPKEILYQGTIQVTANCRQTSHDLQSQFEAWLQSAKFSPIDRSLRESLTPHEPFKLIIRSDDWSSHQLPWHQWDFVDRHPQVAIAFSSLTAQSLLSTPTQDAAQDRVKILAIFGSAEGLDLSVDQTILNRVPNAEVTQLTEPTRSQLNDALWDSAWDIICFSGHSQTQDQVGRLAINSQDQLTLDELRYGLRQALDQGLKLAVFNSCDGLGLASDLLALNLPQFIVMGEPVPDQVAHHFLKFFLGAYSSGKTLSQSHRIARERLQGLEDEYPCASWLPILFENPTVEAPTWASLLGSQSLKQDPIPAPKSVPAVRPWKHLVLCGVLGGLTALGLRGIGLLEPFELKGLDAFMGFRPAEAEDDRLLLITIDDEDIRYQEQQGMQLKGSLAPEALRSLMSTLKPLEPRSVGLDIYRSQPLNLAEQSSFPLFGVCKVPAPDGGDPYGVDPPPDVASPFIGFSDFVVDQDDRLRRQLLAIKNQATTSQCAAQNALSFLVATHYLQTQGHTYELNQQKALDWGNQVWTRLSSHAGGYQGLDAAGYQMLLNYRAVAEPQAIAPRIPLREFLNNQVPTAVLNKLKGRVILIGNTASSSSDRWRTPQHSKSAGLYLQAQMASQLISSVEDGRSLIRWWPEWLEMVWILAWSVGAACIYRLTKANVFITIGWGLLLILICYVGFIQALWLPLIPPLVGMAVMGLVIAIANWKQYPRPSSPRVQES